MGNPRKLGGGTGVGEPYLPIPAEGNYHDVHVQLLICCMYLCSMWYLWKFTALIDPQVSVFSSAVKVEQCNIHWGTGKFGFVD